MRTVQVVGPDGRRQPVDVFVGQGDRLLLVIEHRDRQHRAEHFFPGQLHPGVYVGKDRRLDEVARAVDRQLPATAHQAGTLGGGLFDVLQDSPGLSRVDNGPGAARRIQRVARLPEARLGDQALDEFMKDRALYQQARVGRTHLALVEEDPECCL
ncbi:hypothetical protein D3C78_1284410 [compost metagenome]